MGMGDWVDFLAGSRPAEAYVALPEGEEGPGIVLVHAWWGLNGFFTGLADRLAAEGFRVIAPDLYNGQVAQTVEEAEALSSTLDNDAVLGALQGAADHLKGKSTDKLGLVGFSLGAYHGLSLVEARPSDFGAVALFYGARQVKLDACETAFQCHFAEDDPYVDESDYSKNGQETGASRYPGEIHFYPGTRHWFFEEDRKDAYNAEAAKLAWERTVQFLHANLGKEQAAPESSTQLGGT